MKELRDEPERIRSVIGSLAGRLGQFRNEKLLELGRTDITATFAAQIIVNTSTAMKIHIPGVREQVLSDKTHVLLLELLKFRHSRR